MVILSFMFQCPRMPSPAVRELGDWEGWNDKTLVLDRLSTCLLLPGRAHVVHREWSRPQPGQVGSDRDRYRCQNPTRGSNRRDDTWHASIAVSNSVKSLSVTIDETFSFSNHVDCKASYFHIRALRHIRQCIDEETAQTVASSIFGARLDYCNSILHGTTISNINKIQCVINTLAQVVTGTGKRDHITPVLEKLYWLPVQPRISFKITLIAYKTTLTKKPDYLSELLSFQIAPRTLRSSSSNRLHVDVPRTVFAGRAFHFAAPQIWNSLSNYLTDFSLSLDNFKQQLKKYLFNQAYRHWQPSCLGLRFSFLIIHVMIFTDSFTVFHWLIWLVISCVLLLLLLSFA